MQFNSRAIALLLATCVAIITTAFVFLVPDVPTAAKIIAFLISLSSTYILARLIIEFVFFRQIESITVLLRGIKDWQDISFNAGNAPFNPLKRLNKEISVFAAKKEKEIEILKERENFRREFIADISHELKTPIFSAQGFVHTLLDGAMNDKDVRKKFLKKAAKSLDALDLLVQDILTISQIESGEIKMHFENFDILDLTYEIIDQLETKAEKKGIKLIYPKKDTGSFVVRGDYRRIYQVMVNLITNAIKYTKSGGHCNISFIHMDDSKLRISVEDSGRGIPEQDIPRIFERFYRVDKSRSREKGGTGLGLSIVKHILESHNSIIHVESKLKKGSLFYFELETADKIERIVTEFMDEEEYD